MDIEGDGGGAVLNVQLPERLSSTPTRISNETHDVTSSQAKRGHEQVFFKQSRSGFCVTLSAPVPRAGSGLQTSEGGRHLRSSISARPLSHLRTPSSFAGTEEIDPVIRVLHSISTGGTASESDVEYLSNPRQRACLRGRPADRSRGRPDAIISWSCARYST